MTLHRQIHLPGAVVIGVGAMLGAGVFVAFGPATAAAGDWVPAALLLAAVLAWANADSSARLARLMPESGGAYAYGRERLSVPWGAFAGAAFLVGKTASVAAITTTVGTYLWPAQTKPVAALALLGLTVLAASGIRRSTAATAAVVVVVVAALVATAIAVWVSPSWQGLPMPTTAPDPLGVLQGAGLLFFAFAGYARIATLGEEVVEPEHNIPRAILIALVAVLVVYTVVGAVALGILGTTRLAGSTRALADAAARIAPGLEVLVVIAAGLAALASGLAVLLGLSRTAFAMARDGLLPRPLARLHGEDPRPVVAQLTVGALAGVALLLPVAGAIALSSTAVLAYYAVAHAAALTLPSRRIVPVLGLTGCLLVALAVATTL